MEIFIVQFCIEDKLRLNCISFYASLKICWFSQTISGNHLHCITCSLTCSFPAVWRGVHVLVLNSDWFILKPSSYVLVQRYVSQDYGKHLGPEKVFAEIWFLINYKWKTEIFFYKNEKYVGALVIKQIGLPLVNHSYDYRPMCTPLRHWITSDVTVGGNVDSRLFMLKWSMPFVISCFFFKIQESSVLQN